MIAQIDAMGDQVNVFQAQAKKLPKVRFAHQAQVTLHAQLGLLATARSRLKHQKCPEQEQPADGWHIFAAAGLVC